MKSLKSSMNKLWKDEDGQGMVEYALILALISVVVIGVLGSIGTSMNGKYTEINGKLGGTTSGS